MTRLTPHQLETLRLYAELGTYEAVARRRGVQVTGVGLTLKYVRQKLEVRTTADAVAWLREQRAAS